MPPTFTAKQNPLGPSFVPISMQINADPFITGVTNIGLTIRPQSTVQAGDADTNPTMSFTLGFYTLGDMLEGGSNFVVELDELPNSPSHYFNNPPTSIPLYGDSAVCTLQTLAAIMELAGKTLVITATSDDPEMLTTTAAVTIPIAMLQL